MTILNLLIAIGIPSIIAGLIYIGRKLQILDDIKRTVEKVKVNLKIVSDALIQSDISFDGEKLQAYSPIQITHTGKEYLQKIGFDKIFEENAEDFLKYVESEHPKTDYDIENAAIRAVYLLFDKPYFNSVKDYLYNNPKEDKKELINVAGIYVRDMYLLKKRE